jgi:hypothetical protein
MRERHRPLPVVPIPVAVVPVVVPVMPLPGMPLPGMPLPVMPLPVTPLPVMPGEGPASTPSLAARRQGVDTGMRRHGGEGAVPWSQRL